MGDLKVSAEALRTFANAGQDIDDELSDLISTDLGADLRAALEGSETGVIAAGLGATGRSALCGVGGRFASIAERVTRTAEDYVATDDHVSTRLRPGPQ